MTRQISFILILLIMTTACTGTRPDLGLGNGELMPCPDTPNCVSSQAADEQHYIEAIQYSGTRQQARDHLLQILESDKNARILTARQNYVRAEFTSSLFRFVDDVEFYLPAKQGRDALIHVRSASRIGISDLGVNRKRIERIRSKFITENR